MAHCAPYPNLPACGEVRDATSRSPAGSAVMAQETQVFFALFDTAIGRCAIAWSEHGIVGVQLPARDDGAMRARLLRRHPGACEAAPPAEVARAIEGIVAVVAGEHRDLADIVLDLSSVPEFNR